MLQPVDLTDFRHRLSTKAATRPLPLDEIIGPQRLEAILDHGVPVDDAQRILSRDLAEVVAALLAGPAAGGAERAVLSCRAYEAFPALIHRLPEHGIRWLPQSERRRVLVDEGFGAWLAIDGDEARLEELGSGREWFLDARDEDKLQRRCRRRLADTAPRRLALEGVPTLELDDWEVVALAPLELSARAVGSTSKASLLIDVGHHIQAGLLPAR